MRCGVSTAQPATSRPGRRLTSCEERDTGRWGAGGCRARSGGRRLGVGAPDPRTNGPGATRRGRQPDRQLDDDAAELLEPDEDPDDEPDEDPDDADSLDDDEPAPDEPDEPDAADSFDDEPPVDSFDDDDESDDSFDDDESDDSDDDPDEDEALERLSLRYQPLPLKTMPTDENTLRSRPPHSGHSVSDGSLNAWTCSKRWSQAVQA